MAVVPSHIGVGNESFGELVGVFPGEEERGWKGLIDVAGLAVDPLDRFAVGIASMPGGASGGKEIIAEPRNGFGQGQAA